MKCLHLGIRDFNTKTEFAVGRVYNCRENSIFINNNKLVHIEIHKVFMLHLLYYWMNMEGSGSEIELAAANHHFHQQILYVIPALT